jgi:hypothetical protein
LDHTEQNSEDDLIKDLEVEDVGDDIDLSALM